LSLHRSQTQDPSPLERARGRLGLTLSDIAAALGCSEAAVSRYLSGSRTPPAALYPILGGQTLALEHDGWLRATGRRRVRGTGTLELTVQLPAGITMEEARTRFAEVIAEMAAEAVR